MSKLYYLAHPVGPNDDHSYKENMADGIQWWRALLKNGWNVCAPWVGLCTALNDADRSERALGMSIDLEVMRRCDGIIATGDRVSIGMKIEWDEMGRLGREQINLIGVDVERAPMAGDAK